MFQISLSAARVNAKLTQKEVAKEMGVSNKTIGKWENYTSSPSMGQALKLCALYKIPADHIYFLP